ncbi:hypothetical protein BDV95DRAFT_675014 [Massariosphaeria phaeospora]|uniref:Aminoglycoside phosphotransferase domain-containing protein n=1 Tax=Massariosphaeria phaeospora TaxID=100035 RepID=A0A7C8IDZ8_9PLEO|nr:hypothetical protein BDV95DRAFT_675014 [Massariosphaeria phaeospora]
MSSTSPVFPGRPIQPLAKRAQKCNDSTFIKHGTPHEIQREVDTIFFIQRNTSIPVPSVIESHVHESGSWFSMVLIPRLSLTDCWMRMSEEAQATTQRDLSNYLSELRAIRSPKPSYIGSYDHEVIFTHADLCGDHILVEPSTGKITGIIDWEMAGWWPAYWEYSKSLFGNRYMKWWKVLVGKVLDPFPSELQVERILQQF